VADTGGVLNKALRLLAVVALVAVAWCSSLAGSRELAPGEASQRSSARPLIGGAHINALDSQLTPRLPDFGADLRDVFALPALHNRADDLAAHIASSTQVFQRAGLLNIDSGKVDAAWATARDTVTVNRGMLSGLLRQPLRQLTFAGTKFSELNEAIATAGPARITVSARNLQADAALMVREADLILDFAGAQINVGANPPVWLIEIVRARNVAVINARVRGGTNGILIDNGSNIVVADNDLRWLDENGIVVTGSSANLNVRGNRLHGLGRAGIMLHGSATQVLVENNEIDHLLGHSNWNAGIVLTGRGGDIAADPDTFFLPDRYWVVTEPLVQRLQNPTHNVIMANTIRDGLSSGIYNDGGIANIVVQNQIGNNSKEGVCFDNGATANVLAGNVVVGNGNRWGQTDANLALDSMLVAGRTSDGSSRAKLPGISIDNAMYNVVFGNHVDDNFGGGIKMVRTGLFNVIAGNAIFDNNLGASAGFHFFGIEIGAASPDEPSADLDFVGSSGNIIEHNAIRGPHYSGIFVATDAAQNDLVDNQIVGAELYGVEYQRQ
jgi:parallel beta-helix repeat protein